MSFFRSQNVSAIKQTGNSKVRIDNFTRNVYADFSAVSQSTSHQRMECPNEQSGLSPISRSAELITLQYEYINIQFEL